MLELLKNEKIMVVVAHPDDELLGLGGTLNKLANEYSSNIKVVILGEGITSRDPKRNIEARKDELDKHKENVAEAQQIIGYDSFTLYDFPDNRFDTVPLLDIIKVVEFEKQNFKPVAIFTHHGGDLNIDHQITFDAVITACRPLPDESVFAIFTFETLSGTEWRATTDPEHFIPNFYIEINNNNLEAKINAMEAYEFERRTYPHPRSPEALTIHSQYRGLTIGVPYAEAFNIVRLQSNLKPIN